MECLNQAIIIRLGATVGGNCSDMRHSSLSVGHHTATTARWQWTNGNVVWLGIFSDVTKNLLQVYKSRRDYENSHDDYGESGSARLYCNRSTALTIIRHNRPPLRQRFRRRLAPVTFPSRKRKCKFGLRISSASVIFGDGSLQRNTWRHCTHGEDEVWNYTEPNHESWWSQVPQNTMVASARGSVV